MLHQETKEAEVESDDGLVVVLKLAMDPSGNLVTRLHRSRRQVKIATSGQGFLVDLEFVSTKHTWFNQRECC